MNEIFENYFEILANFFLVRRILTPLLLTDSTIGFHVPVVLYIIKFCHKIDKITNQPTTNQSEWKIYFQNCQFISSNFYSHHTVVKNIPVSILVLLSLSVLLSLNSRQEHSQTSNRHQTDINHTQIMNISHNSIETSVFRFEKFYLTHCDIIIK